MRFGGLDQAPDMERMEGPTPPSPPTPLSFGDLAPHSIAETPTDGTSAGEMGLEEIMGRDAM